MTETILSALLLLLIGAAVLGDAKKQEFLAVGDRVAAGMIAGCLLLSFLLTSKSSGGIWVSIFSSLPIIVYSLFLAYTDRHSKFTRNMSCALVTCYLLVVGSSLYFLCLNNGT